MMKVLQRVQLLEERESLVVINLGTIRRVSAAGYVRVDWDDGAHGYFSPVVAAEKLRVATGDDALPRHRWTGPNDQNVSCEACGEKQTDDNELAHCEEA